MVVTCYSRICSRPELPIFSASGKRVRAYVRVCNRAHAYHRNDTVHERATQEREGTYMSVPSVNGYVAFFDVSVSPSNSNEDDDVDDVDDDVDDDNDDDDDDDEGEEKEEKYDNDEERLAAFRLYLFFSQSLPPSLTLSSVSLCALLSYSFISFLLRCSINEVGRGLLRLIPRSMYSSTTQLSLQTMAVRLSLFSNV